MNSLFKALDKYKEDIEVIATNITAEAYLPIKRALKGEPTKLKEFVRSILILAGAMRFDFIDLKKIEKIANANDILK